jgi:hypothetical protein
MTYDIKPSIIQLWVNKLHYSDKIVGNFSGLLSKKNSFLRK